MTSRPLPIDLPPDGRRNLVLGVIQNYGFEQLKPFVVSLRRTGYSGDVILFYNGIDRGTLRQLRDFKIGLYPFRNIRGLFPKGRARRFLERLSQRYHAKKRPFYRWGWKFLLVASKLRYLLYLRFLRRYGGIYSRVLLTDTRDVLFQADPFTHEAGERLVFFEESHPLHHGPHNATWLKSQLGAATYARLAPKTTLCSGTTLGEPSALCDYLKRMLRLMKVAGNQHLGYGDQALHNAVAYEGLVDLNYPVRICPNGTSTVYTLTLYLESQQIARGPRGEVVDLKGRVIPVLHQYDRHPAIMEDLLRIYVSPDL